MLLHNISVADGWINGTLAIVRELHTNVVQIQKASGETLTVRAITRSIYKSSISRSQILLDLAFATTIHKVQSLTLDRIAVGHRSTFWSLETFSSQ